jgi:hypothetical protein
MYALVFNAKEDNPPSEEILRFCDEGMIPILTSIHYGYQMHTSRPRPIVHYVMSWSGLFIKNGSDLGKIEKIPWFVVPISNYSFYEQLLIKIKNKHRNF